MSSIVYLEDDDNGKIAAVYQGEVIGVCDTEEEVLELVRNVVPIQRYTRTRTLIPRRRYKYTAQQEAIPLPTWDDCPAVERSADRMSGFHVIKDTRILVHAIFANLAAGASSKDLTEWFDGLTEDHIRDVLNHAAPMLLEDRLIEEERPENAP